MSFKGIITERIILEYLLLKAGVDKFLFIIIFFFFSFDILNKKLSKFKFLFFKKKLCKEKKKVKIINK